MYVFVNDFIHFREKFPEKHTQNVCFEKNIHASFAVNHAGLCMFVCFFVKLLYKSILFIYKVIQ